MYKGYCRAARKKSISEALFCADRSQFPGVTKLLKQPGRHSFFVTAENLESRRSLQAFRKSSGWTFLPAGWIFRKPCLAPGPSLVISPPLLSTQALTSSLLCVTGLSGRQ